MRNDPKSFGHQLRLIRKQRGLTVRELADVSGVSTPWITLVENGHRGIGAAAVEKLGRAFGFTGDKLERFIIDGLAGSRRSAVLTAHMQYGPRINNALAWYLREQHIQPSTITAVEILPTLTADKANKLAEAWEDEIQRRRSRTGNNLDGFFVELTMKSGRQIVVEFLVIEGSFPSTGATTTEARNKSRRSVKLAGGSQQTTQYAKAKP